MHYNKGFFGVYILFQNWGRDNKEEISSTAIIEGSSKVVSAKVRKKHILQKVWNYIILLLEPEEPHSFLPNVRSSVISAVDQTTVGGREPNYTTLPDCTNVVVFFFLFWNLIIVQSQLHTMVLWGYIVGNNLLSRTEGVRIPLSPCPAISTQGLSVNVSLASLSSQLDFLVK